MKILNITSNLDFAPVISRVVAPSPEAATALLPKVEQAVASALTGEAKAKLGKVREMPVALAKIFRSEVAQVEEKIEVKLVLDVKATEAVAVEWCHKLAALPPKELSGGQRKGAALLHKLPAEPTGNNFIDRGRQIVIDRTIATMAPGLLQAATWHLNRALESQVGANAAG